MCVEAAVCYALGQEHGDQPTCVNGTLRSFKIEINDWRGWRDPHERANALRRIGVAQLGTAEKFDYVKFNVDVQRITFNLVHGELRRMREKYPQHEGMLDHEKYTYRFIWSAVTIFINTRAMLSDTEYRDLQYVKNLLQKAPSVNNTLDAAASLENIQRIVERDENPPLAFARVIEEIVLCLDDQRTKGSEFLYLTRPFDPNWFVPEA
jgi:hypothetical protein